jgi:glucokinase
VSAATALVADVGGTHARLALVGTDGAPGRPVVLATTRYPDLATAVAATFTPLPPLERVAVCGAGPVVDGVVRLTNCPWEISAAGLRDALGVSEAIVINDLTAVALALPHLRERELRDLGGIPGGVRGPRGVLGPGTGLGVSGLLGEDGEAVPIAGEGGHVSLAASDDREWAIVRHLQAGHGHVSAERVLSGPGLRTLYRALTEIDGLGSDLDTEPAAIARRAHAGEDPLAVEAVGLFTGWLGSVAGDLALTLGATGGVYLSGGILPAWGERFDVARFRARFEAKGRFRGWLAAIPTRLIVHPNPALVGLATLVGASSGARGSSGAR